MGSPRHLRPTFRTGHRRGTVLMLLTFLMVPLIAVLALSIDLGYIVLVRGQLQNAADAAALAAASQLLDREQLRGNNLQQAAFVAGNAEATRFGTLQRVANSAPKLDDADIIYGHLADARTKSKPLDLAVRPYNSAQVTVRRTAERNGELGLFFAPIFGRKSQGISVTAMATYEGGVSGFRFEPPERNPNQKSLLLPFAVDVALWDATLAAGVTDQWAYDPVTRAVRAGKDGIRELNLYPTKTGAPGNLGTVDIGNSNNSTGDLIRQIRNGPSRADFDLMGGELKLGPDGTLILEGDTGLSAAVKTPLTEIIGQPRVIPLYQTPVTGNGNNAGYTIVRFAGCVVLSVSLTGPYKSVTIQPEHVVDRMAIGGGTATKNSFVVRPLQLTR